MDRFGGPPPIPALRLRTYIRLVIHQVTNVINMVANVIELDPPMIARMLYILAADHSLRYSLPPSDNWSPGSRSSPSVEAHPSAPVTRISSFTSVDASFTKDLSSPHPNPTGCTEHGLAEDQSAALANSSPVTDLAVIHHYISTPGDYVNIAADHPSEYQSQPVCAARHVGFGIERYALDPVSPWQLGSVQYLVIASVLILCIAKWVGFCRRNIKYVQVAGDYRDGDVEPSALEKEPTTGDDMENPSVGERKAVATDNHSTHQNTLALDNRSTGNPDEAVIDDEPVRPLLSPQPSESQHSVLSEERSNPVVNTNLSNAVAATDEPMAGLNSTEFENPVAGRGVLDELDPFHLSEATDWIIDGVYNVLCNFIWRAYLLVLFLCMTRNLAPRFLIYVVHRVVHAIFLAVSSSILATILRCKRAVSVSTAIVVAGVQSLRRLLWRINLGLQNVVTFSTLRLGCVLIGLFRRMTWMLLFVARSRSKYLNARERCMYPALDNMLVVVTGTKKPQTPGHYKFVKKGIKMLHHVFFPAGDETKRAKLLAQGNANYRFHLILSSNEFATLVEGRGPWNTNGGALSGSSRNFNKYNFSLRAVRWLSLSGPAFDEITCNALFQHTVNVQTLELDKIVDLAELLNTIHTHELLPELANLVLTGIDVIIFIPIGFFECRRLISELNIQHGREALLPVKLALPHMPQQMVTRVNVEYGVAPGSSVLPTIRVMADQRLLEPYEMLRQTLETSQT